MINPDYLNQLINDHAVIEKALILLEKQAARGDDMNLQIARALIDVIWKFGETCHNQREEQIYFPFLLRKGLPPQGPIGVMLQEHESEREFIAQIKIMFDQFEKEEKLSGRFKQVVSEYAELTKNHIWKENDILYPMGRKLISDTEGEKLMSEFLNLEKNAIGEGGFLRYQTLTNSLEKQAEGRIDLLASLPSSLITLMLDALPVELSLVDTEDRVRYFNKVDEEKIFTRSLSVVGRLVQQCHPQKSVHLVEQILKDMKEGIREKATFWINFGEMFVHIGYYAVRDTDGTYRGCVEMVHDVKPYRDLQGEKRLLDEE
jgi:DUF438 domain-containing protein